MVNLIMDLDTRSYEDQSYTDQAMDLIMETYDYGKKKGLSVIGYWHEVFAQLTGIQPVLLDSGFKYCPATGWVTLPITGVGRK